MNNFTTCVFLGPSLPLSEAEAILPEATFFPPLACGNLLQVLRLKPKTILIIDGYFEQTASVWHKEILYALSKGTAIYGASSMGALRASELARFGMQGIGEIFKAYQSGQIKDDDEVTVLHKDSAQHYESVTEAMMDVRFSVKKAVAMRVIDQALADQIITVAKGLFYQERTLDKICAKIETPKISLFKTWYQSDKNSSQKALDAKTALQTIKETTSHKRSNFELSHTAHLNAMNRNVSSQPFWVYHEALPIQEKVACFSRLLGEDYLFAKRISRLSAIVYTLSKKEYTLTGDEIALGEETNIYDANWQNENDSHQDEHFILRLRYLKKAVDAYQKDDHFSMICLMILGGDYEILKKEIDVTEKTSLEIRDLIIAHLKETQPPKYRVLCYTEQLWHVIEHQAEKEEISFTENSIQEKMQFFLYQHQIVDETAYKAWLKKFDLSEEDFKKLVLMAYRFDYLVKSNNLDVIGAFDRSDSPFWLLDALYLLGFYKKAKALMSDKSACEEAVKAVLTMAQKNGGDVYLHRLDFELGQRDFEAFVRAC